MKSDVSPLEVGVVTGLVVVNSRGAYSFHGIHDTLVIDEVVCMMVAVKSRIATNSVTKYTLFKYPATYFLIGMTSIIGSDPVVCKV